MPEYLEFDVDTFVVVHDSAGFVQLIECAAGSAMGTGQPFVETYLDEDEALARAIELGYVPPASTADSDQAPNLAQP